MTQAQTPQPPQQAPSLANAPPTVPPPPTTLKSLLARLLWNALWLVAVVGFLIWGTTVLLGPSRRAIESYSLEPGKDAKASAPAGGPAGPAPIEVETARGLQETQLALGRSRQQFVLALGERTTAVLGEWEHEIEQWNEKIAPLPTSERGKLLAGEKSLVKRFRVLFEKERPGRADVDRVKAQLETLLEPVRRAARNPENALIPGEDVVRELGKLEEQARLGRDAYRSGRLQIEALLRAAGASGARSEKTLQAALDELATEEALALAGAVEAAEAKAREEVRVKLAKEKANAVLRAGEIEAERARADAEAREQKAKSEVEATKAATEKERLRKKARSPEVARSLAVFLEKGYKQPKAIQGTFLAFDSTPRAQPVSYLRLKTLGALDDSEKGLGVLAWVAGNFQNDRTKWRFDARPDGWPADTRELVRKAQELLRELGPTLVEEGLLAP